MEWLDVLGYVSYGVLCLFALIWTLGVRRRLSAGLPVIIGALTFVVAAILLPVLQLNLLHSLWVIPAIFATITLIYNPLLSHQVPVLYPLLKTIGSIYARVIRIGIGSQYIKNSRFVEAAHDGDIYAIRGLLNDDEADINGKDRDGKTAIGWAAHKGHAEIVKLLIDYGADVNMQQNKGITPLMLAVDQNHAEIATLLLNAGADPNAATTNRGQTALMSVLMTPGRSQLAKLLLEHGAEVNAKNRQGTTPLMVASLSGDADAVNLLLEWGADIDARTTSDTTALSAAKQNDHEETAQVLMHAGSHR
jgi:hypothetical protein